MDSTTYQKIIKDWGWDYCEHDRVRRFCEECKWDVPAFMRQEKKGIGRANSRRNNALIHYCKGKKACQSPEEAEAMALSSQEDQHRQEEMERKERERTEHPDFSAEYNG